MLSPFAHSFLSSSRSPLIFATARILLFLNRERQWPCWSPPLLVFGCDGQSVDDDRAGRRSAGRRLEANGLLGVCSLRPADAVLGGRCCRSPSRSPRSAATRSMRSRPSPRAVLRGDHDPRLGGRSRAPSPAIGAIGRARLLVRSASRRYRSAFMLATSSSGRCG